jgi:hypothetical protein
MGRRPLRPLTHALRRRLAAARAAGRLGPEHEALAVLAEVLAGDLDDGERRAPEVRAYLRALERLGLAPPAAAADDLEALLAKLRGGDLEGPSAGAVEGLEGGPGPGPDEGPPA